MIGSGCACNRLKRNWTKGSVTKLRPFMPLELRVSWQDIAQHMPCSAPSAPCCCKRSRQRARALQHISACVRMACVQQRQASSGSWQKYVHKHARVHTQMYTPEACAAAHACRPAQPASVA